MYADLDGDSKIDPAESALATATAIVGGTFTLPFQPSRVTISPSSTCTDEITQLVLSSSIRAAVTNAAAGARLVLSAISTTASASKSTSPTPEVATQQALRLPPGASAVTFDALGAAAAGLAQGMDAYVALVKVTCAVSVFSEGMYLATPSKSLDSAATSVYEGIIALSSGRRTAQFEPTIFFNVTTDMQEVARQAKSILDAMPTTTASTPATNTSSPLAIRRQLSHRDPPRRRILQANSAALTDVSVAIVTDLAKFADTARASGMTGEQLLTEMAKISRVAQLDALEALRSLSNGTKTASEVTSQYTGTALRRLVDVAPVPGQAAIQRTVKDASSKPLSDFGFDSGAVPPPPPPPGKPDEWAWGTDNAWIVFGCALGLIAMVAIGGGYAYIRQKKQIIIPHDPLRARELEMQPTAGTGGRYVPGAGYGVQMAQGGPTTAPLSDVALTAEAKAQKAAQERAEFEEILRRQQDYIAKRLGRGVASPSL